MANDGGCRKGAMLALRGALMDWLAAALELSGMALVAHRRRIGFAVLLACNAAWIAHIAITGQTVGLLAVSIPAVAINLRGWSVWGRAAQ